MKPSEKFVLALVTAPDLKTARKLAKAALEPRLVACANLIHRLESHYWWQGKLESGAEVLMLLKTTRGRLAALEQVILEQHPYDTPEFIVVPIEQGNARYLEWIGGSVSQPG